MGASAQAAAGHVGQGLAGRAGEWELGREGCGGGRSEEADKGARSDVAIRLSISCRIYRKSEVLGRDSHGVLLSVIGCAVQWHDYTQSLA